MIYDDGDEMICGCSTYEYDSEQSVKKDSLEGIRIQDKLYAGVYIGSWSWIGHADRRGGSVIYEFQFEMRFESVQSKRRGGPRWESDSE